MDHAAIPHEVGVRRSDARALRRLGRTLGRQWRAVRTGILFLAFGVGAAAIALVALPLLRWLVRSAQSRERLAQWLVHVAFRALVRIAAWLKVVRVRGHGIERLGGRGPRLIVANHPSLVDVVVLGACLPQVDCVVKRAHWGSAFMRRIVTGAGYLSNVDGEALIDAGVERLRQGRVLMLFPEGTRSPRGRLGPFHRGAAHIALRSGCDPIPVTIRCDPPAFTKGARWHDVPDRCVEISIDVGAPLAMCGSAAPGAGDSALAARRATAALRAFYEDRLRETRAMEPRTAHAAH